MMDRLIELTLAAIVAMLVLGYITTPSRSETRQSLIKLMAPESAQATSHR